MKFKDGLNQLRDKLKNNGKGGKVLMTQGQFAQMLEQFYNLGYREALSSRHKMSEEEVAAFEKVFEKSDEMFEMADGMFEMADDAFKKSRAKKRSFWSKWIK